jgi:Polysulphide reductase, NrfD
VLKEPVWTWEVATYLFLGGLAGASSVLAAGTRRTGRPELARVSAVGAGGAIVLALGALVLDLGRPARFLNMLRVVKPSSPMNMGSWLLAAYAPAAGSAALLALTGRMPRVAAVAGTGAAVLGPALTVYTAPLISDTAIPAWHEGYREMPFVFAGSAALAAGGLGLLGGPVDQVAPARAVALAGAVTELAAVRAMRRRLGLVGEPYRAGRGGRLLRASAGLGLAGVAAAMLGRRSRTMSALAGAACLGASALSRFGVVAAGRASARDPRYTVAPQRARLDQRPARTAATPEMPQAPERAEAPGTSARGR